jgi:hypothetical protein
MQLTSSIDLDLGQATSLAKLLAIPSLPIELTLTIDFKIAGSYLPATWYEPAEYPEFELNEFISATIEFWDESSDLTWLVDVPESKLNQIPFLLTSANYSLLEQLAFEYMEDL